MTDAAGSPSTADVPEVWWSPLFGPIEESKDRHGDKYVGFSRQSFIWVGLAELPADAVRLVPAGGSAPADEPEYLADVERNAVALAAEVKRLKVALAGHIFDGESMNTREAIRHELILIGQEHGAEVERMRPVVEAAERWVDAPDSCASAMETADYVLRERLAVYRAGGSAPHQGATTDAEPAMCAAHQVAGPDGRPIAAPEGGCLPCAAWMASDSARITRDVTAAASALAAYWCEQPASTLDYVENASEPVRDLIDGLVRALLGAGETTDETHD